ncbi:hypothetical protein AB9B48_18815, partial [Kluyvera ascorbata]|uniref:hypothetical protein n=1 Tax=Kluyvera ascorbata TaxID=51288 RepID=UPI00351018F0
RYIYISNRNHLNFARMNAGFFVQNSWWCFVQPFYFQATEKFSTCVADKSAREPEPFHARFANDWYVQYWNLMMPIE